jgi:hypothetical protein
VHDIPSKIYVASYHVGQTGNGNILQLLEPGRACKQARMGWGNTYFCPRYHDVLLDFTSVFILNCFQEYCYRPKTFLKIWKSKAVTSVPVPKRLAAPPLFHTYH